MKVASTQMGVAGQLGTEKGAESPALRKFLSTRSLAGALFGCAAVLAMVLLAPRLAASFVTAPVYPAGPFPDCVAVGDFNSDGILDLAMANYGSYGGDPSYTDSGVSILLGNGDGTFQAPRSYRVRGRVLSVAVGDFNGDGNLDLVTANENGTIGVLLGNGNGTFQPAQNFAGFYRLTTVAVGDFNGDGKLDLVVAGEDQNFQYVVAIFLGNGDGTFQSPQNYPLEFASFVAVGDFNRDGNLDVAALGSVGLEIFLGNGDGTLQPGLIYPVYGQAAVVGDFNGDGIPDLAVAGGDVGVPGSVAIVLGNGDGTFQLAQTYPVSSLPLSVTLADFNHDGYLDLAVGTEDGLVSILLGNGDGTFQAPQGFATGGTVHSLAVGDVNGDGHLDLASVDDSGVFILLGKGDGTLQAARVYAVGDGSPSVAVGDFNRDGIADLALAYPSGTLSILLGNGDGSFRLASSYVASAAVSVVVADFNGDGIPDVAVLNYIYLAPSTVQIFFGNGDGTLRAGGIYAVGRYAGFLAAGDFNGDGFPDLVVSNTGNRLASEPSVSVLLNHGDGTFQAAQNYPVDFTPGTVVVGDFNSDGHLDLALATAGPRGDTLSILLGNGDGTFQAAQEVSLPPGVYTYLLMATGDFNGDGHVDLAVGSSADQTVRVLLGNGDGTFQAGQQYPGYGPFAIGDFNRDGFLDLVIRQNYSRTVVLQGNGDGTFHAVPGCPVAAGTVVADFNGDGYPDLAGGYAGGVVILPNAADW